MFKLLRIFRIRSNQSFIYIYKEKAGVISENPLWICFCGPYMYNGDTLIELFKDMIKNWNSDNALIG